MSSLAQISIHASQFPENVRKALLDSLRCRQVNHKFHYDSIKQTQKWLALHQAYSPSRTEADCTLAYDRSFEAAAGKLSERQVRLIGLGCGGGQKDARLLQLLCGAGKQLTYIPCDVSVSMVLVAYQTALSVIPAWRCFPLVCDLATMDDLLETVAQAARLLEGHVPLEPRKIDAPAPARLVTFLGMIPNFEPHAILPQLTRLLRPGDYLLFSANLAPGQDYAAGVHQILPQYDNELTREWLFTFLLDLGIEKDDGNLRFVIEDDPGKTQLKRIAAYFDFRGRRAIEVGTESFEFLAGESIRLFFSYRHTPESVRSLLVGHGLRVLDQWLTRSQEEGIFLCDLATV